jgi:hypothetical protein
MPIIPIHPNMGDMYGVVIQHKVISQARNESTHKYNGTWKI